MKKMRLLYDVLELFDLYASQVYCTLVYVATVHVWMQHAQNEPLHKYMQYHYMRMRARALIDI